MKPSIRKRAGPCSKSLTPIRRSKGSPFAPEGHSPSKVDRRAQARKGAREVAAINRHTSELNSPLLWGWLAAHAALSSVITNKRVKQRWGVTLIKTLEKTRRSTIQRVFPSGNTGLVS